MSNVNQEFFMKFRPTLNITLYYFKMLYANQELADVIYDGVRIKRLISPINYKAIFNSMFSLQSMKLTDV